MTSHLEAKLLLVNKNELYAIFKELIFKLELLFLKFNLFLEPFQIGL